MKIYITILAIFFSSQIVFSQITSGGGGSVSENKDQPKQAKEKKIFDNAFYMRLGVSLPTGKFGGDVTPTSSITSSFQGLDKMSAKPGPMFELGTIFYMNLAIPDQFKVGIDVAYLDVSINPVNWNSAGSDWASYSSLDPFLFIGQKYGVAFSYNPTDFIIIDASLKMGPSLALPTQLYYNYSLYDSYSYSSSGYGYDVYTNATVMLKKSFGLNFRFHALIVGWEYSWGRINTQGSYSESSSSGSGWTYTPSVLFDCSMPTSSHRFTVGLKF